MPSKKEQIIELQAKLAELEAEQSSDTDGNEESYSLTEADLNKLIDERVKEYAKKAPKGQPAFTPKEKDKKVDTFRKLEMKR